MKSPWVINAVGPAGRADRAARPQERRGRAPGYRCAAHAPARGGRCDHHRRAELDENEDGKRDPEMHQAKKGNQWRFGMKMHTGVDAEAGLIHGLLCTAVEEADVAHAHELLHGRESRIHGDAGCTGLDKRDEVTIAQDSGRLRRDIDSRIAMKRGQLRAMAEGPRKALDEWFERRKGQARAIVEHPIHVIKNLSGCRELSYRGLAKIQARAIVQAAPADVYVARRRLMAQGISASAA